jgi:hypothetical protein
VLGYQRLEEPPPVNPDAHPLVSRAPGSPRLPGELLLQRDYRYAEAGYFNPLDGSVRIIDRPEEAEFDGWFEMLGPALAVLYRQQSALRLRIEDRVFTVDSRTTAHWKPHPGSKATLTIEDAAGPMRIRYQNRPTFTQTKWVIFDPTMTDPEDFDFGLFLFNVFNSPGRAERIGTYRRD